MRTEFYFYETLWQFSMFLQQAADSRAKSARTGQPDAPATQVHANLKINRIAQSQKLFDQYLSINLIGNKRNYFLWIILFVVTFYYWLIIYHLPLSFIIINAFICFIDSFIHLFISFYLFNSIHLNISIFTLDIQSAMVSFYFHLLL